MKVRKAVIPVAGYGTRFLPSTKAVPKEMLNLVDKPCIQYIVEEAVASGITDILFITNRGKGALEDHFDRAPELEMSLEKHHKTEQLKMVRELADMARVYTLRQKETKGLGHAILCAREFVGDEPFAILLGDDMVYNPEQPAIAQLMEQYEKTGCSILGCQMVPHEEIRLYGSMDADKVEEDLYRVKYLIEKPNPDEAPSDIAVLGRHVLRPEVFSYLEKTKPGYGGEIQLTDALHMMAQDMDVYGYLFKGRRYDIGDKLGYLEATIEIALRHPEVSEGLKEYLKNLVKKW